jgi:hypothetical protein
MRIEQYAEIVSRLMENIESVIVGKRGVVEGCLVGLLSGWGTSCCNVARRRKNLCWLKLWRAAWALATSASSSR